MKIIINMSSMIPIYEQIVEAVKGQIASGNLHEGDALPSVRALAKDLKISALTVKKAYDHLEEEGFTATVHGKGTYVTGGNASLMAEQQRRDVEQNLERVVQKARAYGLPAEEVRELLDLILNDR